MNAYADKNSVKKTGVSRLTLTDFRNYEFLRLNLELSPVIISGEGWSDGDG